MHPCSGLTDAEARTLTRLGDSRECLELGALFGASTIAIARLARVVWSVDWHHGDVHTGPQDSVGRFMANIRDAKVDDRVITVVGRFRDVTRKLPTESFDFVFVDGTHTYGQVVADLLDAHRLRRPGGLIAAHDWGRFDVERAARDVLGGPSFLVDSLAVWS